MSLLVIALLGQSPAPAPDVRALEAAISRPRLDHCDELVCHYRPLRTFAVRAVACEPAPAAGDVVCVYERAEASPVLPVTPGEAPAPDRRVWNAARTEFRSVGTGWIVLLDSDD